MSDTRTYADRALDDLAGGAGGSDDLGPLLGAVNETAPANDTASSGLNGRLQRAAQRLTSLIAQLPAALTGLGNLKISIQETAATLDVRGNILAVSVELTRPADTTAYAANDVVSNSTSSTTMQEVANAARTSGGSGYITGVRISTDKKSITPRLRLHLYNTNGATLSADNAAWRDAYADEGKRIGTIDLPAMTTGADTTNSTQSAAQDLTVRVPYSCVVTSLYWVLEALDAFTPANAEKFSVTLYLDRN